MIGTPSVRPSERSRRVRVEQRFGLADVARAQHAVPGALQVQGKDFLEFRVVFHYEDRVVHGAVRMGEFVGIMVFADSAS